jgi:hypothetical protein
MQRWAICITVVMMWAGLSFPATYYVDPTNGSDLTGSGSKGNPWRSLEKTLVLQNHSGLAKTVATEENIIVLKGGNYGAFNLSGSSGLAKSATGNQWTTYQAAPGEEVVFDGMQFDFNVRTPLYMRFDGIKIRYPGNNGALGKTTRVMGGPVGLTNVSNVEYVNTTIWGAGWTTGNGIACVYVNNCSKLKFHHCDIGKQETAMFFADCQDVTITFNHIHNGCSSGIKYATGNSGFLIEGNNIHDFLNIGDYHGSAISIRSGDVTIRGNIMHDGFSSSGMMFYDDTPTPKSNVTIENNLVYDINNYNVMSMYHCGTNVKFRNNTFVGFNTRTIDWRYWYETAFGLSSMASGYNGTGVSVYNNVFIGMYACGNSNFTTGHNIMWSYDGPSGWTCTPPEPHSHVVTCSYSGSDPTGYFKNGFFVQTPDFSYNHRKTLDYHLKAGSPAINFGDPANQTAKGLGTVDDSGFIQDNGVVRDASHHSAGAYEYASSAVVEMPGNRLTAQGNRFVISISPYPFTDHINVTAVTPMHSALTMNLYSGDGKLRQRAKGNFMDTKTLPSGLYILEVLCGSDRVMEKVMK